MKRFFAAFIAFLLIIQLSVAAVADTQTVPAIQSDGVDTIYQHPGFISSSMNVPVDSCMFYMTNAKIYAQAVSDMPDDIEPSMMAALNRVTRGVIDSEPTLDNTMIQTRKDGTYREHDSVGSGNYYMVPTREMAEYVADYLVECASVHAPYMIALEEPELWTDAGYSQSFKDAWREYYGTDWVDPNGDIAAFYLAGQLRVHMFCEEIKLIAARIKEVAPDTKIVIATHSVVNYRNFGIAAGVAAYAALDCVDGIIGQTWSDTVGDSVVIAGKKVTDPFCYAYCEYASYIDASGDKPFYSLVDPAADSRTMTWDEKIEKYRFTISAQLCLPQIQRFEIVPWPMRAFANAETSYKTIQLNVYSAENQFACEGATLTAGTTGIKIGISDSYSHQSGENNENEFMSLVYPLLNDGIPLGFANLDNLSEESLEDCKVLIVTYELMKPLSQKTNETIAKWVNNGGTLLYIGGEDALSTAEGMWWAEDGKTPLSLLAESLGLNATFTATKTDSRKLIYVNDHDAMTKTTVPTLYESQMCKIESTDMTSVVTCGDITVCAEAKVGLGNAVICTVPLFVLTGRSGDVLSKTLVKHCLEKEGAEYEVSDSYIVERGDFTAVHAFSQVTLTGTYIDMFDNSLTAIDNPVIAAGSDGLYLKVDKVDSVKLLFCNTTANDLVETEDKTSYSTVAPAMSYSGSILQCPRGVFPQKITVKRDNMPIDADVVWDVKNSILTVSAYSLGGTLDISVEWGDTVTNFSHSAPVTTVFYCGGAKGEDADFIFSNNTGTADTFHFADINSALVYKFSFSDSESILYSVRVSKSYIMEISTDGETFTEYASYAPEDESCALITENTEIYSFSSEDCNGGDELYVRIRHMYPAYGNGPQIAGVYTTATEAATCEIMGDAERDGTVTIADALTVFKHTAGIAEIEDVIAFTNADLDGNGAITISDALTLFKRVAGIE